MNLFRRRRMLWTSGLVVFLGGLLVLSLPAFGDDGDKEALKKLETIEGKIKRAYKESDNGQVIALLKEAGGLQIPKAVDVIAKYGFFHPDVAVFEAAKQVLGEMRKETVVAHIINEVLKGDRIEVRIGLTDVLEKIPGPKTEEALIEVLYAGPPRDVFEHPVKLRVNAACYTEFFRYLGDGLESGIRSGA